MLLNEKSPHINLFFSSEVPCGFRCETCKKEIEVALPIGISELAEIGQDFEREHEKCKP